ncbi:MAG TPA: ABC transporter ATP-binding protein [Acidobacteriaceae bacterium]|nr:ABC transporter ATP-binding protein [Acidobacteriaceae bacterium]
MHPLLQVERLSVSFSTDAGQHRAVDDVSFSIAAGESFALVGESGSGKSVTSLAILRLLDPRAKLAGSIRFEGQDWLQLPERAMRAHRGRDASMIFQDPMMALNPVMPIGRQIAEAIRAHEPGLSKKVVRQRVLDALESVSIPESRQRFADYPHQFSGGQRQRIMIAMALVNRPRLLIADEPTTALDVTVQAQILAVLRHLKEQTNAALLFISHDLSVVSQVAGRVAVMRRGKIVESAPTKQIFSNPQHAYTRSLLAAVPTMHSRRDAPLATWTADAPAEEGEMVEVSPGHWVRAPR